MALITPALLAALQTALKKSFNDAYKTMRTDAVFTKIATAVPSSSTSNTYDWLGDFPTLQEWIGDRVIKDMKAQAYQITNKLYEATLGVKRTAVEDDNYGHYAMVAASMGEEAAQHPDRLMAALMAAGTASLCYDGQNFFDTDHPVYPNVDGTGVAATVSNYNSGGGSPGAAWYLLDTRKALKPFIFQERTKPEFEDKTNAATSDHVFIKDQYLHGVRYRCNGGYGFWQMAYCSKAALDATNFEAARDAMTAFKGDGGRPLGIRPTTLVVPSSLRSAAENLIKKANLTGGRATCSTTPSKSSSPTGCKGATMRVQIKAIAAAGFFRLGQFWPHAGRIVPQDLYSEEEWKVLMGEPNLHLTPIEGEAAAAIEAGDLGALVGRIRAAIAELDPADFQADGKPKLDALKKRLPADKARITTALRDDVWQSIKEPWNGAIFAAPAATDPGKEPETPPAAG